MGAFHFSGREGVRKHSRQQIAPSGGRYMPRMLKLKSESGPVSPVDFLHGGTGRAEIVCPRMAPKSLAITFLFCGIGFAVGLPLGAISLMVGKEKDGPRQSRSQCQRHHRSAWRQQLPRAVSAWEKGRNSRKKPPNPLARRSQCPGPRCRSPRSSSRRPGAR